jgi:hypothetical protein
MIFCQVKHRKNACLIFCTATSGVNIMIIIQGSSIGILLALSFQLYIRHALTMINRTCKILCCASCFALSSERTYLSYGLLIFFICFWFLSCSHVAIFTRLKTNQLYQHIRILLMHIIVYLISTSLYPIKLLYIALTQQNENQNSERFAIETFITFQTNTVVFTYYCTSAAFRVELKTVFC